jgi:3-methyladenine DNA glycosylase/8-oxoguanine DNA glycosylase
MPHPDRPRLPTVPAPAGRGGAVDSAGQVRAWVPPGPVDLALTLGPLRRGPGDPAFRVDDAGGYWRASRTPVGAGAVRVRVDAAAGTVRGEAWGPGAGWLLEALPALLGEGDDPAAFRPRHRVVHETHRRHPGLRLTRTGLVLESLIPSVLEQKVTADEAYRAWRLLLRRHGEPAPGPAGTALRMRVMPDARGWALVPSWEWHRAGVDAKRAGTVMRAVRAASAVERLALLDPAEAAARLTSIQGIGPWTAAETVQRTHGAPDALTLGDLHLPHAVTYALTGEPRGSDALMEELLAPYAGQRHRAARLLLLGSGLAPRRAPRMAPRDFTRI